MVLSVIIVNYNVKYYLEQCLESVRRASRGLQVEVFVVDNLSTDGSIAYLKERGACFILSSDAHSADCIAYKFDEYKSLI